MISPRAILPTIPGASQRSFTNAIHRRWSQVGVGEPRYDGARVGCVIRDVGEAFGRLARELWVNLAKPEWLFAGPALAALENRPDDLVAIVREHMKPAEKPDFDREGIAKWVEQLDDPLFAVRERASASLSRLGREALPLLHDHLSKTTSKERQERLRRAIEHVRHTPVPSNHLRELRDRLAGASRYARDTRGTEASRPEIPRPDLPTKPRRRSIDRNRTRMTRI